MTSQTTFQVNRELVPPLIGKLVAPRWSPEAPTPILGTDAYCSPAVASDDDLDDLIYVVWQHPDTNTFCWSYRNGDGNGDWTHEEILENYDLHAHSAPALTRTQGGLLLVWEDQDHQIYSSLYKHKDRCWTPPQPVKDSESNTFCTSAAPALVSFRSKVLMVWNEADATLWYSLQDQDKGSWSPKCQVGAREDKPPHTDSTPALVYLEDDEKVLMAWKDPDNSIYIKCYGTRTWRWDSSNQLDFHTAVGPALACYNEQPLLVWKGVGDTCLYCSFYNGNSWSQVAEIPGACTSMRPAVGNSEKRVYAVWKLANSGELHYSTTPTIGGTKHFGDDTKVSFAVIYDHDFKRTFIKVDDHLYARGRMHFLHRPPKNVVLNIRKPTPDNCITAISADYTIDDAPPNSPSCRLQKSEGSDMWSFTLSENQLPKTRGEIHVRVGWEPMRASQIPRDKKDPVIIVNVSN